jgi:hypothetical protein
MSDTPRTDAQLAIDHSPGVWSNSAHISTDFARTLERELNEAKAELCEIKCELALSTCADDEKPIVTIRRMSSLLTEAKAQIAHLETCGISDCVPENAALLENNRALQLKCDQLNAELNKQKDLTDEAWVHCANCRECAGNLADRLELYAPYHDHQDRDALTAYERLKRTP